MESRALDKSQGSEEAENTEIDMTMSVHLNVDSAVEPDRVVCRGIAGATDWLKHNALPILHEFLNSATQLFKLTIHSLHIEKFKSAKCNPKNRNRRKTGVYLVYFRYGPEKSTF